MKKKSLGENQQIQSALESCANINKMDRVQINEFILNIQQVLAEFTAIMEPEAIVKLHLGLGDANTKIGQFAEAEAEYIIARKLCADFTDQSYKVKAVNGICILSAIRSDYLKAIEGWKALLAEVSDLKIQADIYNNLGIAYSMTDKHQDALDCQYQCLKIDEELAREAEIATDYFNLASSYMKLKQRDKSLELYHKSAVIFEKNQDLRYLSFAYSNLSMLHADLNEFDLALDYAYRSLELKRKFSNELEIGNTYANIGNIFKKQKAYSKARDYYQQAQAIFENGEDKIALSGLYNKLAWMCYETGETSLAEEFGLKGYDLAVSIKSQHIILEAGKFLSVLYAEQKQYELAYQYLHLYTETYLDIFEDNPKIMIAKSEADYYRKKTEDQSEIYRQKNIELTEMNKVVSEQSRLLYIANKDLEKSNILMRKLFSVIGHDIRGPVLTSVEALSLLRTKELNAEETDNLLTDVALSLSNTGNLLGDLLSWSSSKTQSIETHATVLNVVPIIADCLSMYKSSALVKYLDMTYEGETEIYAMVNKNYLHTIIRNLVHNAIKFTPEQGKITVKAYTSKTRVMIEVSDTGIGISAKAIKQLLSGNAEIKLGTNAESGTGFGIGLCLTYIKQINGKLTIKSKLNEGSTFTVSLIKAK